MPREGLTRMSDDPNPLTRTAFAHGFRAGQADAAAEIERLTAIADHWHFIANNPGTVEAERKRLLSDFEVVQNRNERAKILAALDAQEQAVYDQARAMIDRGDDDVTIAKSLSLFLPIVANLRAGAL